MWLYGLWGGGIKSIDCRFLFSIRLFRFIFPLSLRAGFTITLDQTITWSLGRASGDAVSSALFRLRYVGSAFTAANNRASQDSEKSSAFSFWLEKRNCILNHFSASLILTLGRVSLPGRTGIRWRGVGV
jgi:hypothetical protein